MMGHRAKLVGGEEYDVFKARKYYFWQRGQIKKAKRRFNKRQRLIAKQSIRAESRHHPSKPG